MECSMCGDVGFSEHLFRCVKCHSRFQHRYCSKSFFLSSHADVIGHQKMLCDWCLVDAEHDHLKNSRRIEFKLKKRQRIQHTQKRCRNRGSRNVKTMPTKVSHEIAVSGSGLDMPDVDDCMPAIERTQGISRSKKRFRPLHEILC